MVNRFRIVILLTTLSKASFALEVLLLSAYNLLILLLAHGLTLYASTPIEA